MQTVIPEFAADLAVTGKDRADGLIAHYAAGRPVVIGGHSLGGAMAADYAARHADQFSGLILLAAYPPEGVDLTRTSFGSLSLLAEHEQASLKPAPRIGLDVENALGTGAARGFDQAEITLSLLAEHDQVAAAAKVQAGMTQLSPSSRLEVIPGAVHAFFGRYGPQQGDGVPTVRREQAEEAIIERIVDYLSPIA